MFRNYLGQQKRSIRYQDLRDGGCPGNGTSCPVRDGSSQVVHTGAQLEIYSPAVSITYGMTGLGTNLPLIPVSNYLF